MKNTKNNYTHKKTNKEFIENKNKMLINEFIKNTTKNSLTDDITPKENEKVVDVKKDDEIKKLKDEILKLKNQLKIEKDKRKTLADKLTKSDKKYSKVLEALETTNSNVELLEQEKSKYLKERDNLRNELNQLKSHYANIDDGIEEYKKKIQSLSDRIETYKEQIAELSQKDIVKEKDLEIEKLNIEKEELEKVVKLLKKKEKIYKFDKKLNNDKVNIQKSIADISKRELEEILSREENNFFVNTYRNLNYYIRSKHKKLKKFIANFKKFTIVKRGIHGVIKKELFSYKFVDVSGEKYKIDFKTLSNKPYFDGVNCLANITDKGKARITQTYPVIDEMESKKEITPLPKKPKVAAKKEKEDKFAIKPKILLITSMSATNYKSKFESVGLKVDVFDSYDENAKRLNSILKKYDMVFYCIKHSRHYCGDVIKNQSDYKKDSVKYNFLTNDSVTNMLSLINEYVDSKISQNEAIVMDINEI